MKKDTPRIFLDSNIWFSAFYGSLNCSKIVGGHLTGKIKAVISSQVIEESVRNLREKKPSSLQTFQNLLLNNPPEIVKDPEKLDSKIIKYIDKKDQPIFSAAMTANVRHFITGNLKDFQIEKLDKLTGIKIISPKQAVELFNL